MSALALVQARMSSSRLPGKVLADVDGEPMIGLLLRRLRGARTLDGIVVATSVEPSDDPLAEAVEALGFEVRRGPLDDVVARFLLAAGDHPGPYVRVTGDCPLIDPGVVDALVERFATAGPAVRYGSNVDPERTYPDGLDAEVFSRDALLAVDALAADAAGREHVTTVLRADPVRFPQVSLTDPRRLGDLRWTVDTAEDLAFVRAVVARLGDRRHVAGLSEILAVVNQAPSLADGGLRG
jgi:spore coat polysaccharide biosynthesis protein SpsF